jgi:hypothetical protein
MIIGAALPMKDPSFLPTFFNKFHVFDGQVANLVI